MANIVPYQFEPQRTGRRINRVRNNESDDEIDTTANNNRMNDRSWCRCERCVILSTSRECLCCTELVSVAALLDDEKVKCITEHSAFATVCLNRHVLRTALIARNDLKPYTLVEPISNELVLSVHGLIKLFSYVMLTAVNRLFVVVLNNSM